MQSQNRNIVVVDDDAEMRLAIERLLSASGFLAITFHSAEALLDSNAATNAACLILDIHLPGFSGFDLYRRLRERGHEIPVIFITAYDDQDARTQANELGAVAFLNKPFRGQQLLAAIKEVLETE